MDKKTVLAVVLSILVIMTFQAWMGKNYPNQGQQMPAAGTVQTPGPGSADMPMPVQDTAQQMQKIQYESEKEQVVETDRFIITFSNIGGAIKKIALKEFPDSDTGQAYELVNIEDPRYYAGSFNLVDGIGLDTAIYRTSRYGDKISYITTTANLEVEKVYNISNYNDYIELYVIIRNHSQSEIRAASRVIIGSGINVSGPMAQRYINTSAKVDGKIVRDRRDTTRPGDVSWAALNSKYFCILVRPYQLVRKAFTSVVDKGDVSGGIESSLIAIQPGSETTQQYLFYIGPVDAKRIKALGLGLEDAVNYGVFDGISKLLLSTLRLFHKILRNWGLAIICLTFLVNLILSPLTKKSYRSMKAMQDLQPHMENLKSMHKDNPQKMNKELMELYRKHNVNPLGGCLPMLFQMPIFIALYHALVRSIELRGANFLWIKDLSKPDAVGLPFSLPIIGNSINILPILMMAAMIVQQKISTPSGASAQQKQQQQMMIMMPVIFVIIFYTLPSGLVMYWLVNTVLMMVHQYRIKKAPVVVT